MVRVWNGISSTVSPSVSIAPPSGYSTIHRVFSSRNRFSSLSKKRTNFLPFTLNSFERCLLCLRLILLNHLRIYKTVSFMWFKEKCQNTINIAVVLSPSTTFSGLTCQLQFICHHIVFLKGCLCDLLLKKVKMRPNSQTAKCKKFHHFQIESGQVS